VQKFGEPDQFIEIVCDDAGVAQELTARNRRSTLSQLLALTRQSHINYLMTVNDLHDINSFILSKFIIFWIWHYQGDLDGLPPQLRALRPEISELGKYQFLIYNSNDG
jgi:hypothetical protein